MTERYRTATEATSPRPDERTRLHTWWTTCGQHRRRSAASRPGTTRKSPRCPQRCPPPVHNGPHPVHSLSTALCTGWFDLSPGRRSLCRVDVSEPSATPATRDRHGDVSEGSPREEACRCDHVRRAPVDFGPPPEDDGPRGGRGRGGRDGGRDGGRGRESRGESFDRMPPQDIAAEQGVLGGMMLSKDAIADVVEVIKSQDFYRPAHELIYDAILDLYSRGEPADPVTVSAELTNKGELTRVGGTPYLHDLISTVPTAANAAFYARIVAERAVLRRLVEAAPASCRWATAPTAWTSRPSSTARRPRCTPSPRSGPRRTTRSSGTSSRAPSTRSRRARTAARGWSACRPASPTSTTSPTACTPGR